MNSSELFLGFHQFFIQFLQCSAMKRIKPSLRIEQRVCYFVPCLVFEISAYKNGLIFGFFNLTDCLKNNQLSMFQLFFICLYLIFKVDIFKMVSSSLDFPLLGFLAYHQTSGDEMLLLISLRTARRSFLV